MEGDLETCCRLATLTGVHQWAYMCLAKKWINGQKFGARAELRSILSEKMRGGGGSSCRLNCRFGKREKCGHCNTGWDTIQFLGQMAGSTTNIDGHEASSVCPCLGRREQNHSFVSVVFVAVAFECPRLSQTLKKENESKKKKSKYFQWANMFTKKVQTPSIIYWCMCIPGIYTFTKEPTRR